MKIVRDITWNSAGSLRAQSGPRWVTLQFEIGLALFFVKISVTIRIIFDQGPTVYAKGHTIHCRNGSVCWCSFVHDIFLLYKMG